MDGVGTPIIERPRPLPGHDTPNPANDTYTLTCEEPFTVQMNRASLRLARTAREALGDVLGQRELRDRIDEHEATDDARETQPA